MKNIKLKLNKIFFKPFSRRILTHIVGLLLIINYTVFIVISWILYPNYDWTSQTFSDLGNPQGNPEGWVIWSLGPISTGLIQLLIVGDTVDFMRGAALSKGGKPIIVLQSTRRNGTETTIVPHLDEGASVILSQADVHYVVTEWGVAYLHGKTIRDRVIELISIAHPKFRQILLDQAKNLKYVYSDQILPYDEEGNICVYPKQYETYFFTKDKEKVVVRPLKTTDEPLFKDLYYSLDERDQYLRFFELRKEFGHPKTQCEVNIDYKNIVSMGAFIGNFPNEQMVGNATYYFNPKSNMAEFGFVTHKNWRGKGVGSFLLHHLIIIAKEKGIDGFYGNVHIENKGTIRLIQKAGYTKVIPPPVGEKELFFELFFEKTPKTY